MAENETQDQTDEAPSPLDQDRAKYAQAVHQGLDQYLGGVNNLAPKSNEQAGEMALDATPIVGNVRSAQRGYEAAQNHDWLGAALGAVGAVPVLGGIIAGPAARTANHEALAIAKEMQAAGHSPEQIYKGTRWWQGGDGKWRFEIPDDTSMMYIPKEGETPLGNTLHHPKLYEAYPDLADRPTHVGRFETETGQPLPNMAAGYDPDLDTISLNSANPINKHSPLLHEIQHAVQNREGFSPGSNMLRFTPEEIAAERRSAGWGRATDEQIARDLYRNAPGEREAREVQERMRLTPDERIDKPPHDVRKHKPLPKLPEFGGLADETLDLLNNGRKHGGSISDKTYALLHKIKRQDGGSALRDPKEANKTTQKAPGPNRDSILKSVYPNGLPDRLSILKDVYPELVPPSGSWIPKEGLQPEDPNLGSFRALGSSFTYNPPPDARESSNIEDRRFTHPSLPTSDFGNSDFVTSNAFSRPKPVPPSSAAGVQGMSGTQSGPSVNRNPWTANTTTPWDTQVIQAQARGGAVSDRTNILLAKLKLTQPRRGEG